MEPRRPYNFRSSTIKRRGKRMDYDDDSDDKMTDGTDTSDDSDDKMTDGTDTSDDSDDEMTDGTDTSDVSDDKMTDGTDTSDVSDSMSNDSDSSDSDDSDNNLFSPVTVNFDQPSGKRTITELDPSTNTYICRILDEKQFARNTELVQKKLAKIDTDKDASSSARSLRRSRRSTTRCTCYKGLEKVEDADSSRSDKDVFTKIKRLISAQKRKGARYEIQLRLDKGEGPLPPGICLAAEVSPEDMDDASHSIDLEFQLRKYK